MKVAVVGGGIVGLFTAWYLDLEGADVTLFDPEGPGAGSVHAAGIIEPATAYPTNRIDFLRIVWRLWRNGTCTFRRADPRWLVESLRQLERPEPPGMGECLHEMAETSVARYAAMAGEQNDFEYSQGGLLEQYDDARHFQEERAVAVSHRAVVPVEVREDGPVGALYFPTVSWLHTEHFVARLVRELPRTTIVRRAVDYASLDGTLTVAEEHARFDVVVVSTGVGCRRLGVPLTGVRGYGWHAQSRRAVTQATIFVDRGIAVVPFAQEIKVTGGWDFDLSVKPYHSARVLEAARELAAIDHLIDFKEGSRPCTPDGLPTVGRKDRMVVSTGGFRLGWSFAPALGRHAARLALGQEPNDPFLARFCGSMHSGAP